MMDTMTMPAALAGDYLQRFPGEVAALLEAQPTSATAAVLEREPLASAAPVFAALTPTAGAHLLSALSDARAAALLRALDPARAAALCAGLETDAQERLLRALPDADARELRELMAYPPDSAASLMTARVQTFRPQATAGGNSRAAARGANRGHHRRGAGRYRRAPGRYGERCRAGRRGPGDTRGATDPPGAGRRAGPHAARGCHRTDDPDRRRYPASRRCR